MKRIIMLLDTFLIMAIMLTVTTFTPDVKTIGTNRQVTYVNSKKITKEIVSVDTATMSNDFDIEVPPIEVIKPQEEKQKTIKEEKEEKPVVEDAKTPISTNESFAGKMSGYGADIGEYTASGYALKNGIFYPDKVYGSVRILSAGREYPFGTIVHVSNSNVGEFIGIVLDYGPNIGREEGKKFAFDLLYQTSEEAAQYEVSPNAHFEILRKGW